MEKTRKQTSHIPPFGLRMQPDLKDKLERLAMEHGRSLNAEIVQTLERALDEDKLASGRVVFHVDVTGDQTLKISTVRDAVSAVHGAFADVIGKYFNEETFTVKYDGNEFIQLPESLKESPALLEFRIVTKSN